MSWKMLIAAMLCAGLSACATWAPTWSEYNGSREYARAEIHVAPTVIDAVDGQNPGPRGYYGSYKVEPGQRTLSLEAPAISPGWKGGTTPQRLTLEMAPCKRYYIIAHYDNPLGTTWTPQVSYVEPIAGCMVASR